MALQAIQGGGGTITVDPTGVNPPIVGPPPLDTQPWFVPPPPVVGAPVATAQPAPAPLSRPPVTNLTGPDAPAEQVQAPGAAFAPAGFGGPAGFAPIHGAGTLLNVNYTDPMAFSSSSPAQFEALPFVAHRAYRPSLGGIGRVLEALGLVGPHRLPRELERHTATRAPLTP